MLNNIAEQLKTSSKKRHLLFAAATALTILLIGYNFGTFDEAMHIPFLKAEADPTLYPGDSMIALHDIYYSYFWYLFIPFFKIGWLEPVLFITHLTTIYLSYWAIWDLSDTLFQNALASLFSVLCFIVPHFGFVGFPVFEFAPLSRTFVLPFLLIAMNQFFRGRIPLAFAIAGLMYNIHVVLVNFVVAMFGLACLLEFRRIGIKNILPGFLLFLLAAFPVLLWKAGSDPVDLTLRPEWVAFLNQTFFLHIFAMLSSNPGTWIVMLGGLSTIALFFISLPAVDDSRHVTTARIFIYAGIIVLAVNVITVYWLPVTIIIQSQITRIGLWILVLAYLFLANWFAKIYQTQVVSSLAYWLLLGTFLFSPIPLLVLLTWGLVTFVKNMRVIRVTATLMPFLLLGIYVTLLMFQFWRPGIYIYGQSTPWVDIQDWARENTQKDARFITPPEKIGVQESDWRVHSERASFVTLSELLVAAFEPGYEIEWKARFEILAPRALANFNGNYFWNVEVTKQAYNSLSSVELLRAACDFNAHYIVVEKPHVHNLPIAYQNSEFVTYDVSDLTCRNPGVEFPK